IRFDLWKDIRRDLDEITVEISLSPFSKKAGQLVDLDPGDIFQDRVGFANQLHVAVLDPVVDHFYIMPGAVRTHVAAARIAVDDRGDLGEDRSNDVPRFPGTTRHEGGPFERPFLAARNAT